MCVENPSLFPWGGTSPAHTHLPWAHTLCGIEGLVGGREAPAVGAMICVKEHSQLVVAGDEVVGRLCPTEPARSREQAVVGALPNRVSLLQAVLEGMET